MQSPQSTIGPETAQLQAVSLRDRCDGCYPTKIDKLQNWSSIRRCLRYSHQVWCDHSPREERVLNKLPVFINYEAYTNECMQCVKLNYIQWKKLICTKGMYKFPHMQVLVDSNNRQSIYTTISIPNKNKNRKTQVPFFFKLSSRL